MSFLKKVRAKYVVQADAYADKILKGYLEALLFAESDGEDPLDKNYSIDDLSSELVEKSKKDIEKFVKTVEKEGVDLGNYNPEQIGHDLLLTRNRHGAGFLDGDYEEPDESIFDKAAKSLREVQPYVGDDGKIYTDY
jgi:hypothetical protein